MQSHLASLEPDGRDWFVVPISDRNDLFVKAFRHDVFWSRLRYTILNSQARKEWDHLVQLYNTPVPAPAPVAIGESFQKGLLRHSILVCEHIPDAITLREHLEHQYRTPGWSQRRERLWADLAKVTDQLLSEGFYHDDFHDQNILVTSAGENADPASDVDLWVTDLHRATTRRSLNKPAMMRMIAFLVYSMLYVVPLWECRRFYRALQERASLRDALPPWSTFTEYVLERQREHRKSRSSSCFQDNDRVDVSSIGNDRWTAYHDSTVSRERVNGWLERLQSEGPPDALSLVKERSDGRIYRWSDEKEDVLIKEHRTSSLKRKCQRFLGTSKARNTWRNSYGLGVRHVRRPQELALIEPNNSFSGRSTYFVQQFLSEARQIDDYLIQLVEDRSRSDLFAKKRSVIEAAARYMRSLHREGIYHKDFKSSNLLLTEDDEESYTFYLIDLDRVAFFDRPLPDGPRIRNLAQLNGSIAGPVTRSDRLRFWTVYVNGASVPFSDPETVLMEVMNRTRERDHVWP